MSTSMEACRISPPTSRTPLHHNAAQWAETSSHVPKIQLSTIPTVILEKVVQYFHYKARYDQVARRPKFDIPLEIVTQVLLAANFLDT